MKQSRAAGFYFLCLIRNIFLLAAILTIVTDLFVTYLYLLTYYYYLLCLYVFYRWRSLGSHKVAAVSSCSVCALHNGARLPQESLGTMVLCDFHCFYPVDSLLLVRDGVDGKYGLGAIVAINCSSISPYFKQISYFVTIKYDWYHTFLSIDCTVYKSHLL